MMHLSLQSHPGDKEALKTLTEILSESSFEDLKHEHKKDINCSVFTRPCEKYIPFSPEDGAVFTKSKGLVPLTFNLSLTHL